jgi:hypothetical protein
MRRDDNSAHEEQEARRVRGAPEAAIADEANAYWS